MSKKYTINLCLTSEDCESVDEDEIAKFDTYNEAMAFIDDFILKETPIADVYAAELYLFEDGKQIDSMLLDTL